MNISSNFTDDTLPCGIPHKESEEKIVLKILAYSAIFCVALAGNARVILLVLQSSSMRRRTINLFVVNMAISDLLISLFAMPRIMIMIGDGSGIWYVTGNIGNALCKLYFFVQDTATAVSMESLIIIACDRYFALAYPTHAAPTTKRRLLIIAVTWIIAIAVHFPYLFIYNIQTFGNASYCMHMWSLDREQHYKMTLNYYLVQFVLFVIIPIVVLTALYSGILYKLKQQGYLIRSVSNGSSSSKRRREYHVLKMAIAILAGFAICWVPFNTYVFIVVFIWEFMVPCNLQDLQFFVFFMAYSNSAINPCIYIYFSRNFQKLSKRHLTKKRAINLEHMEFCRVRDRNM